MKKIYLISLLSILSLNLFCQIQPTVFEGSTVIDSLYSPALEGNLQGNPSTQPVKVYLPPHYENFPDNKYPVVYLLHCGDFFDYNTFYAHYNLLNIVNQLISNKSIVPMIIVTPNAVTKYGNCNHTNSYVTGNWEDYLVQDVIGYVDSNYCVLDHPDSRGLSGFSIGGYGTVKTAMKHPSLFNSIGLIGPGAVNFEDEMLNTPVWRDGIIAASCMDEFDPDAEGTIPIAFASAAAWAPDSTNKPILCRFPYTCDGVFIDSIWQRYLENDPLTMLPYYADSLRKINAIQFYIGDDDEWVSYGIEPFHQALLDNGIKHGYEIYSGGHDPEPVLDDMLQFFSEQLFGTVPTIHSSSDFYLDTTDILMAEMDMDGKLYIVPASAGYGPDSIYTYQVVAKDALANQEIEIQLSGFEFGKYRVFAVSRDSAVSNIPEEFCVVPDKSPPTLNLVNDSVNLGDSILISISRDGSICLHAYPVFGLDTLKTASEILSSYRLITSIDAIADEVICFSTDGLSTTNYWIYGFDQYGIVTGPILVDIVTSMGPITNSKPDIMLFPNPVQEMITIQSSIQNRYELAITSINGQLLYSDRMEGPNHQIDLSSFEKGLYFITFRSRDYVRTEKIIKL
jgi:S-formylglutathione hydrolase